MARQYEFRPAKAAQRRMVVDACRRLTAIASLENYQYVGFGGVEFIDFVEFHRGLGISTMTSIERDTNIQHRLEFNKPYAGVKLLMGEARDQLPNVDWKMLTITWLDYTTSLTGDVRRDLDYVVRSSIPGSVVLVTVNSAANAQLPQRLPNLRTALGELVSDELTDKDMAKWGATRVERAALQATAHSASREAHGMPMRQLFNFEYADEAKMLTWGGIVTNIATDRTVDDCRFEDLNFVRSGDESFEIRVPVLTDREMAYLESELVGSASGLPSIKGIQKEDILAFAEVYRWRVGAR